MKVALDTNVLASSLGTRGLCADVLRVVLLEKETLLRAQAIRVEDTTAVAIVGIDANDARVLGDAVAGSADVFVTGDGELQALGKRAPLPVRSPRQFWMLLR